MSRQNQINLLKRLLHYVDTRTTAMADAPWRNEVSAYTDAGRLAEEQRILFRASLGRHFDPGGRR